jgi:hypothetical protein
MEAIEEEIEVELLALLVESMSLTKIYIAKVAGAVMLVRGLVGTLAPNMIARGHGVQKSLSGANEKLMREACMTTLCAGIFSFCCIWNDFGLQIPQVVNNLLWVTNSLHSTLNVHSATIGPSAFSDIFLCMGCCLACVYISLYVPEYFQIMMIIEAMYMMIGLGMPLTVFPKKALDLLGFKATDDLSTIIANSKGCGFSALGILILYASYAIDAKKRFDAISQEDAVFALAYGTAVSSILYFIKIFIQEKDLGDIKGFERNVSSTLYKMGLYIVVTLLLLLPRN